MSIQLSRAHEVMKAALDFRAARQDMISSNIANADTPFYRPRDIDFAQTLAQKEAEAFHTKNDTLTMARTNSAHMEIVPQHDVSKPSTFFRDGHMARNDGNSVDLDVESTEMTKNQMMFKGITAAIRKEALIFKSVLDASAKTS